MKKVIISILVFLLLAGSAVFLFRQFIDHIYNRKDCDRFIIDHVELRTGINIPDVKDGTCECTNTFRKVSYTLDLTPEEVQSYLSVNYYEERGNLYINEGEERATRWYAELNPDTRNLSIAIDYLD